MQSTNTRVSAREFAWSIKAALGLNWDAVANVINVRVANKNKNHEGS